MNRSVTRWVAVMLLSVTVGACSQGPTVVPVGGGPGGEGENESEGSQTDWNNPIEGVGVASFGEAQAAVSFEIYQPNNLGSPVAILMTNPSTSDIGDRVVAAIYDTTNYGRVVVKEHLPDEPAAQYDSSNDRVVEAVNGPQGHGSAQIVTVRGDRRALLTISPDQTDCTIWWLEPNGVELIVRGPDLTPTNCVVVANLI
jgi:hypothetical protein